MVHEQHGGGMQILDYSTTKAAIAGYTKGAAMMLMKNHGIRVNGGMQVACCLCGPRRALPALLCGIVFPTMRSCADRTPLSKRPRRSLTPWHDFSLLWPETLRMRTTCFTFQGLKYCACEGRASSPLPLKTPCHTTMANRPKLHHITPIRCVKPCLLPDRLLTSTYLMLRIASLHSPVLSSPAPLHTEG